MKTWDIFCRVVDNYGDIGVSWRLARQLANEHQLAVRLWVDELAALQHIWPATKLEQQQQLAGVTVCVWSKEFQVDYIADVVIEAFACHIPESYIAAMLLVKPSPIWLNVEYLSAESWVEDCHQLSSINPQNGLRKTFYFPGFSEKTGGLLRERDLFMQRNRFMVSTARAAFLTRIGAPDSHENRVIISLFSYENTAIASLLLAWSESPVAVLCLVPAGKALVSVNRFFNAGLQVGDGCTRGALRLQVIPFLTQVDYDHLLWACDINFVRGEDSFVRAQWAAKPCLWHIYPQEDEAHLVKLKAFLEKYTYGADSELASLINQLSLAWNQGADCSQLWANLFSRYADWREHSQVWCKNLGSAPDLAANLVLFCQKIL